MKHNMSSASSAVKLKLDSIDFVPNVKKKNSRLKPPNQEISMSSSLWRDLAIQQQVVPPPTLIPSSHSDSAASNASDW